MTSGGIIIPKTTNKKPTKKALPNCFHSGSFLALGKAEKQV